MYSKCRYLIGAIYQAQISKCRCFIGTDVKVLQNYLLCTYITVLLPTTVGTDIKVLLLTRYSTAVYVVQYSTATY